MTSYQEIREKVEQKIGRDMFDERVQSAKVHPSALWGEEKPRGFLSTMVCITLYKDLFGKGYLGLGSEFQLPFHASLRSIWHNVLAIRLVLEQLGDAQSGTMGRCPGPGRTISGGRPHGGSTSLLSFWCAPLSKVTIFAAWTGFDFTRFFATLWCFVKSTPDLS